jgi:hypothetical protein
LQVVEEVPKDQAVQTPMEELVVLVIVMLLDLVHVIQVLVHLDLLINPSMPINMVETTQEVVAVVLLLMEEVLAVVVDQVSSLSHMMHNN